MPSGKFSTALFVIWLAAVTPEAVNAMRSAALQPLSPSAPQPAFATSPSTFKLQRCGARGLNGQRAESSGLRAAKAQRQELGSRLGSSAEGFGFSRGPGVRGEKSRVKLNQANLPPGGKGGNDFMRQIQQVLRSFRSSGLVLPLVLIALWSTGQFGWLFSIFNVVFLLIFIVPLVAVFGVNLWVRTQIVNGECPNCKSPVMIQKGQNAQSVCLACGTPLVLEDGVISRASVYNTQTDRSTGRSTVVDVVDVDAIDVDAKDTK